MSANQASAQQGETLDAILFRTRASTVGIEEMMRLNVGLLTSLTLSAGAILSLPPLPTAAKPRPLLKLWD